MHVYCDSNYSKYEAYTYQGHVYCDGGMTYTYYLYLLPIYLLPILTRATCTATAA